MKKYTALCGFQNFSRMTEEPFASIVAIYATDNSLLDLKFTGAISEQLINWLRFYRVRLFCRLKAFIGQLRSKLK